MRRTVAVIALAVAALYTTTACSGLAGPDNQQQQQQRRQVVKAAAAPADPADPEQRADVPAQPQAMAGTGTFTPSPPESGDGGHCHAVGCPTDPAEPPSDTEPPVTCDAIECQDPYTFAFGYDGQEITVDVPADYQPIERSPLWYDFRDDSEQYLLRVRSGGEFDKGGPADSAAAEIERLSACDGFEVLEHYDPAPPSGVPYEEAYHFRFRYDRHGEAREGIVRFIGDSERGTVYMIAAFGPEDRGPYLSDVLNTAYDSLTENGVWEK